MKTTGMKHQLTSVEKTERRSYYGLLHEQGTGKTWSDMADTENQFGRGKIDGLLVLAPNGVHTNWTRIEIPTHMSAPVFALPWRSGMGVGEERAIQKILERQGDKLRVLAMSYDAVNTPKGYAFAVKFLESCRVGAKLSCDESQKIKTHDSKRTEKVLQLSHHALVRRILSGTPITKNPGDAYSQLKFLHDDLPSTTNYRAFFAEYAQLMDAKNPKTSEEWRYQKEILKNPRMAFAMRVAHDEITGLPIYKNLDKLAALVAKHSYRVLKSEALDLPPKVYTVRHFELSTKQMKAYKLMEEELRILLENGELKPVHALASLVKLQQITSGYVMVPGREEPMFIEADNPRIETLCDIMEDVEGKVIIWARFVEELNLIARRLRAMGRKVAEYHGGVKHRVREENVDWFQKGDADVFLGNAQAGGTGLTLTAANTTIYYSNSYNNGDRMQSEDRNHRKGTTSKVLYIDLCCIGTIDETIARSLQMKSDIARAILDERKLSFSGTVDFTSESE